MKKNERQRYLWNELQDFERKTHMNPQEQRELRDWVAKGNRVYENGDYLADEDGRPMNFLDAYRFYDDLKGLSKEEVFALLRYREVDDSTVSDEIFPIFRKDTTDPFLMT